MSDVETVYCSDTSSLITVQRRYPQTVFPGLWDCLGDLAGQLRLVGPREVLNELDHGGDDEILRWAKLHEAMFWELDADHVDTAKMIINAPEFEGLVDHNKELPDADPYVIALAAVQNAKPRLFGQTWIVVSDEAVENPGRKPKIPSVCRDPRLNLECVNLLGMLKREGWQFHL